MSHGVLFSLHALLMLSFHFSHLVNFSLRTVCNFTLSTAACNRLHAFPWSVRVGCLISACNVRVILARKLDIFIHFVRYCCCLNMLDSGKYFPPRVTVFLASIFVWSFRQAEIVVRELQNQLLELKERRPRPIPLGLLFCLFNKS